MKQSIQRLALLIMIMLATLPSINGDTLQETNSVPPLPSSSIKCVSCPCVNPCDSQQQLPPPPPPPPEASPPPPPPVVQYCPPAVVVVKPPPPPRFIYVTNPPTYGYHPFTLRVYSGGGRRSVTGWTLVAGCVVFEWLLL